MSYTNNQTERTQDTKLVTGVQQHFIPGNVSLTVAGVTYTPAQVIATIDSRVTATDSTTTARAALAKLVADAAAIKKQTQPIVNAVKQVALIMYANQPDVLTAFGLAPKKVPVPLTLAQKAERAAKAKATRAARNTMGPKAKAKVKGTATPAATAASGTAAGTPASAPSASATTTAPVVVPATPAASGGAGTGHA
jgi:hypothetical protein